MKILIAFVLVVSAADIFATAYSLTIPPQPFGTNYRPGNIDGSPGLQKDYQYQMYMKFLQFLAQVDDSSSGFGSGSDKHRPQIVQNGGRIIFLRSEAESEDPDFDTSASSREPTESEDDKRKFRRQAVFTGFQNKQGYYSAYFPVFDLATLLFAGGLDDFEKPILDELEDSGEDEVIVEESTEQSGYMIIPITADYENGPVIAGKPEFFLEP